MDGVVRKKKVPYTRAMGKHHVVKYTIRTTLNNVQERAIGITLHCFADELAAHLSTTEKHEEDDGGYFPMLECMCWHAFSLLEYLNVLGGRPTQKTN